MKAEPNVSPEQLDRLRAKDEQLRPLLESEMPAVREEWRNSLSKKGRHGMIELTIEQRKAVTQKKEQPPRAVDPDTHTTYVLIPEDEYALMKAVLDEEEGDRFVHAMYPHVMEVFGREGWDDPAMDIYDDLDPRRQS